MNKTFRIEVKSILRTRWMTIKAEDERKAKIMGLGKINARKEEITRVLPYPNYST